MSCFTIWSSVSGSRGLLDHRARRTGAASRGVARLAATPMSPLRADATGSGGAHPWQVVKATVKGGVRALATALLLSTTALVGTPGPFVAAARLADIPGVLVNPGPALDLGVCVDETGSLSGAALPHTKKLLHRIVGALVHPGSAPIHLYLREVAPDSYSVGAALLTANIPGVLEARHLQLSPFAGRRVRDEVAAAYRTAKMAADASLVSAQAAAQAALRAVDVLPSRQLGASDIMGCPAKLGDITRTDPGPKRIVLVTDFEPAGFQTSRTLRFGSDTHVDLIDYCASGVDAPTCAALVSRWTGLVTGAGATVQSLTWDEMDLVSPAELGIS